MQPKIIDADTGKELWTGADCADHIGVSYAAWRNYSANHHTRLWLADEVHEWHATRPKSPAQLRQ
ncbi:hypothetical protein [Corynebacterium pseudodiphtheriticum]|uniref:hypothetical protein n=1 Tax=Corynebacterium pseudodiphtheriticum TaxID=37637 RepID=UPI00234C59C6|nr:hypothetical protein [Corynebacterium pseudodiphtheriticum]MDC7089404.1 hypothetical protein [Corynebacterium pseudodiphtheriticum]MDK4240956.1 hypothetical protein [Corynebacterium pseudodiphtheriticum]MDK4322592.1 hypothetical protein [Corynebacterium pseudodiphtheriticum]